jgi:hypothetical protein
MLKQVFLAASLLAPVLAYGASAATDLSIQIVPSASSTPPSSPAPPPPSTGPTPPAAAQAVGFTTPLLYMDFTGTTTSSYNGTTFNINDVSGDANSWLYCDNTSGGNPTNPIMWLPPAWTFNGGTTAPPCNQVFLFNDGGQNALDITYPASNQSINVGATEIATQNVNQSSNITHDFPVAAYYEIVFRTDSGTLNMCPSEWSGKQCSYNDFWAWWSPSTGGATEWDFVELAFGGGGVPYGYAAVHGWGDGAAGAAGAGWGNDPPVDYTQYHAFGVRVTTDGTNAATCNYLDGASTGPCVTWSGGTSATEQRQFIRLTVGPQGNAAPPSITEHFMIQRVAVWTCSSGATGPCATGVDSTP